MTKISFNFDFYQIVTIRHLVVIDINKKEDMMTIILAADIHHKIF